MGSGGRRDIKMFYTESVVHFYIVDAFLYSAVSTLLQRQFNIGRIHTGTPWFYTVTLFV